MPREWQADLKARIAWGGFDGNLAAMAAHDAGGGFEAQSRTLSDALGGEERLKQTLADFRRDARSVIANFDQQAVQLARRADPQLALALHGVDGVVDQVSPDLVQLTAARANLGQGAVEIQLRHDAVFHAVPQHQQRAFETLMDVHLLLGSLVHITVLFNRAHQLGDAAAGVFDFTQKAADGERSGDARE